MNKTDKRLAAGFRKLVAAQDLPAPPMAEWLIAGSPPPGSAAPGEAAAAAPAKIELAARWPEDLELKAPTGLVSMAATLALAGSLALLQASGWVNPIDRGAGVMLADPAVQSGLESALHFAQTGNLTVPATESGPDAGSKS